MNARRNGNTLSVKQYLLLSDTCMPDRTQWTLPSCVGRRRLLIFLSYNARSVRSWRRGLMHSEVHPNSFHMDCGSAKHFPNKTYLTGPRFVQVWRTNLRYSTYLGVIFHLPQSLDRARRVVPSPVAQCLFNRPRKAASSGFTVFHVALSK